MKKTRFALLQSVIALMLCFTMLLGTTYAWFTDSVTSAENHIIAGNLDVELEYSKDFENWNTVNSQTNIFDQTYWEPGHTEVVYLKVVNEGNLALKYRLGVNIVSETGSRNQAGESFLLSDYIMFGAVKDVAAAYADRNAARAAVTSARKIATGFETTGSILNNGDDQYVALVVYMPEDVGNVANHATGEKAPEIKLGVNLYATQEMDEEDSFGNTYDSGAALPVEDLHVSVGVSVANQVDPATNTLNEEVTLGSQESTVYAKVPTGVKLADGADALTLKVDAKDPADSEANVTLKAGEVATPIEVHVDGLDNGSNDVPLTITLKGIFAPGLNSGNYAMYHVENGVTVPMNLKASTAEVVAHNDYYYDAATGDVTMMMASFSEVLVVSNAKNYWDGKASDRFAGGTGAENDPYLIGNAQQLAYFRNLVDGGKTFEGEFVKLSANICLASDPAEGEPISFDPIGWGYDHASYNRDGADGKTFKGTFDGDNHYIFGLYQNGWDLEASTETDYTYTNCGFGLFASATNAKFRNLTITGANIRVECVEAGVLVGLSQGNCTYDNIKIYGCSIANYQRPAGGVVGEVSPAYVDGKAVASIHTFTNIIVDNKTTVGSLWGDFDAPLGGVIGAYWDDTGMTEVSMTNCHIGCVIDAYSDVTSAYQWYAYRRAGMLIGNSDRSMTTDGRTVATAGYLTCSDVHIYYGDWINYHYCQFTNQSGGENTDWQNNYPWVRVEEGKNCSAYSNPRYGHPIVNGVAVTNDDHKCTDTHNLTIPFGQLYGGGQGVYGGGQAVRNHYDDNVEYVANHEGVTIEDYNCIITMMSDGYVVNLMVVTDGTSAPDFNGKDFNKYRLEKDGKAFAGWVDEKGNPVTSATFGDLTQNTTIYAKWSDYTVTYMDRGEIYAVVGVSRGQQYTVGSDVAKPANRTENGREVTFKGWVNAAGNTVGPIEVKENVVVYDSWNGIYTARFVDQLGNLVDEIEFVGGDKTLKYTPSLDLVNLNQKDVTVAWESYTLGNADIVIRPVYTYAGDLTMIPVDKEPKDGETDYYYVAPNNQVDDATVTIPGKIGQVTVTTVERIHNPDGGKDWNNWNYKIKTIIIDEGVETINDNGLAYTPDLETVHLPSSLTYIGKNAFSRNVGTTGILIENDKKVLTIYFNGSREKWDSIEKHKDWNNGLLRGSKVVFSDGTTLDVSD